MTSQHDVQLIGAGPATGATDGPPAIQEGPVNPLLRRRQPVVGRRGLHLDLKGLPPTAPRLLELLDVAALAGYDLLLVEWEDMFPWRADPRFRSPYVYEDSTVDAFHRRAAELGLEVIPLIQCLGHMEMPLSVAGYEHLREVPERSDVLNPLAEGARALIEAMIDDILDRTPRLRYLHLGGDEAWTLGSHPDTRAFIERHDQAALYLHHLEPMLDRLLARGVRPVLWHDMLIEWDDRQLQRLGDKADIMFWGYREPPDVTNSHYHSRHIRRFHGLGLTLWGATAFKGADGSTSDRPDLGRRRTNTAGWVEIAGRFDFKGLIATGWSRYSAHRSQTEPIDAALDALLVIGAMLHDGEAPDQPEQTVLAALNSIGERSRFERCRRAIEAFRTHREALWGHLRIWREQQTLEHLVPARRISGVLRMTLQEVARHTAELHAAVPPVRDAWAGLVPEASLDEYLHVRLEAIRYATIALAGEGGWLLDKRGIPTGERVETRWN